MRQADNHSQVDDLLWHSLHGPVECFMEQQGKRIRAGLTELSYVIGGGSEPIPEAISEAIECLHAGSLVIDDIQDDSSERRSRPTLHRQMGVPLAINAGNFMYFRALEVLTESEIPDGTRCLLTQAMIRAARVCHEGQAIDLSSRLGECSVAQWRLICEAITQKKTGTLVSLSTKMGALAANAEKRLVSQLGRFGMQVGVALQMRNDLEELRSFAEGSEDRCDDLRNQRITWPWAWLSRRLSEIHCEHLAKSTERLSTQRNFRGMRQVAAEVYALVKDVGHEEINRRVDEPMALLSEYVIDDELLDMLKQRLYAVQVGTLPLGQSSTAAEVRHEPTT
ncbi:MAG: polyprenyl synthetase family protein [Planctomycetota bacterium]